MPHPLSESEIRQRVEELAPWYQNIQLTENVSTKNLDGERDILGVVTL